MPDPKEKPDRPHIKERTPKKRTAEPFPHLRRPAVNPVEEIMGLSPRAPVPEYRTTEVPEQAQAAVKEQVEIKLPEYRSTSVPEYRGTGAPESRFYKKPNEASDALDRHLSGAESKVLDQLVRLIHGFNLTERQIRIEVLLQRTGYSSDKTVRLALAGLEGKGIISRSGRRNSPGGEVYRILDYSGTAVPQYPGKNHPGTAVEITGELKTDLKERTTDDEAAPLARALSQAERELTGKVTADASKWQELADLLITELRIAAGRTTVSSVPAFLAEHLRRRLWKVDKKQLAPNSEELAATSGSAEKIDSKSCPDCFGSDMWYPEGFDKGVARCQHLKLRAELEREGKPPGDSP